MEDIKGHIHSLYHALSRMKLILQKVEEDQDETKKRIDILAKKIINLEPTIMQPPEGKHHDIAQLYVQPYVQPQLAPNLHSP